MDNLQTIDSYNKIILDNEWLIYKIINKYTSHLAPAFARPITT